MNNLFTKENAELIKSIVDEARMTDYTVIDYTGNKDNSFLIDSYSAKFCTDDEKDGDNGIIAVYKDGELAAEWYDISSVDFINLITESDGVLVNGDPISLTGYSDRGFVFFDINNERYEISVKKNNLICVFKEHFMVLDQYNKWWKIQILKIKQNW